MSLVVGFMLAPFVVRRLGDEGYGYWALILTATSYFLRLDLGIQSAVGQFISRHLADNDSEELNDKTNSALTVLLAMAAGIVLVSVGASLVFPQYFHVTPASVASTTVAFALMGAAAAVKLPFSVFQAMLVGKERFDILASVTITMRIINAVLVYSVLSAGKGILGLAVVMASTQFVEGLALVVCARKAVPQISVRLFHFRAQAFKELFSFGSFNFLINLAAQLGNGFWAVILARQWGPDRVTRFSIGYEVIPYMVGVANAATLPLLHGLIPMDVREDARGIRTMFLYGTRYFTALICAMGVNLLLLGEQFIGLWMGEKYLAPLTYGSSGTVLVLLTLANMASHSSAVAQQILFARRKNRLFALMTSLQTLGIITLALILVPQYGIFGMAVSMLIPLTLIEGGVIPFLAAKHGHASVGQYWLKGILPNVALTGSVYLIGRWGLPFVPGSGWSGLILGAIGITALQAGGTLAFILLKDDRERMMVTLREVFPFLQRKGA